MFGSSHGGEIGIALGLAAVAYAVVSAPAQAKQPGCGPKPRRCGADDCLAHRNPGIVFQPQNRWSDRLFARNGIPARRLFRNSMRDRISF